MQTLLGLKRKAAGNICAGEGYNSGMGYVEIAALGQLAERHWGLVTTADAEVAGVSRKQLAGMAEHGALQRITQGVYRMAGAPEHPHQDILSTWLALGGHHYSNGSVPPVVAAGETAAIVHEVGDFYPGEIDMVAPKRRATRREGVRLRVRRLKPSGVTYVHGIPVLRMELALPDLVAVGTDPSLVADALSQAMHEGRITDQQMLEHHLKPHAEKYGYQTGDGAALLEFLQQAGRVHA